MISRIVVFRGRDGEAWKNYSPDDTLETQQTRRKEIMAGRFAQAAATRELPAQEDDRIGYSGPPRFHWFNGVRATRPGFPSESGSFYIKERELRGFKPGAPWTMQTNRFGGDDNEIGYTTETLGMIILSRRAFPYRDVTDSAGNKVGKEWHPRYIRKDEDPSTYPPGVKGPSSSVQTEYLCIPDGFYTPGDPESIQLAVFVTKGLVGMRMAKEIIPLYQEDMLDEARKVISSAKGEEAPRPAWYTFRIVLSPEMETVKMKGGAEETRPLFTHLKTYNIYFQLPVLNAPEEFGEAEMDEAYIGDEMLDRVQEIWQEMADWRNEKRGFPEAQAPAQNGNGQQRFDYAGAREALKRDNDDGGDIDPEDIPF